MRETIKITNLAAQGGEMDNITITPNHDGLTSTRSEMENMFKMANYKIIAKVGNTISCNGQQAKINKIEYKSEIAYGLTVYTDNGQKIQMSKLFDLVNNGIVKIS